jgi:hypothetical protein
MLQNSSVELTYNTLVQLSGNDWKFDGYNIGLRIGKRWTTQYSIIPLFHHSSPEHAVCCNFKSLTFVYLP